MTLIEQITADLVVAMKAKDAGTLSALRMLKSAIGNAEIASRGSGKEFDDAAVLAVVKSHAKKLAEAIVEYEKGGRDDLVASARAEMNILEKYVPAAMSEDEVRKVVATVRERTGLSHTGQLTGAVMKELAGKADGSVVRKIVEEALTK